VFVSTWLQTSRFFFLAICCVGVLWVEGVCIYVAAAWSVCSVLWGGYE